jgi:hypothetical protein
VIKRLWAHLRIGVHSGNLSLSQTYWLAVAENRAMLICDADL